MCTEQLELLHFIKMQTNFKKAVHQFLMMVQIYEFYIKWVFREIKSCFSPVFRVK